MATQRLRPRHPMLIDVPQGVWYPAAVGIVPGYPKTRQAFERRNAVLRANSDAARRAGKTSRSGTANGWAGRTAELNELRQTAQREAAETVAGWPRRNAITADEILNGTGDERDLSDEAIAAVATAHLLSVIRSPTYTPRQRLDAAKFLLPFLKPVPRRQRRGITLEDTLFHVVSVGADIRARG